MKLENRILREEKFRLQAQLEEETQVNVDLQEQVAQLTKHVKVRSKVTGSLRSQTIYRHAP